MFNLFRKKKHPGIDPRMSITDARYVVADTELTGLDEKKDCIVSLGAVRMIGGRIDLGDTFYRLVSPRTGLTSESVVIHEITPSEVVASPDINAVLTEFLEFCGDDVLVGHFVSIDLAFLDRELKRIGRVAVSNPVADTFTVYEWLRKRMKNRHCFETHVARYKLYDIIKCFDIPVNGAHNAIMDAYATAQLFQRFLPLLNEAAVKNIDDLLKIGIPFKGGDLFRLSGEFSNF